MKKKWIAVLALLICCMFSGNALAGILDDVLNAGRRLLNDAASEGDGVVSDITEKLLVQTEGLDAEEIQKALEGTTEEVIVWLEGVAEDGSAFARELLKRLEELDAKEVETFLGEIKEEIQSFTAEDFLINLAHAPRLLQLTAETDRDETDFENAVRKFFAALDERDEAAMSALFSPAAKAAQPDLDAQIEAFFAFWPEKTDFWVRDIGPASSGSNNHGLKTVKLYQRFPVSAGGEYYMCRLELITRYDTDESQIGIRSVALLDIDSEYAVINELGGMAYPEEPGLFLMTGYDSGEELRYIEGWVHRLDHLGNVLTEEQVRAFFASEEAASVDALLDTFGPPAVRHVLICYEMVPENGEPRYLMVGPERGNEPIESASIVSDLHWIEKVYENPDL